MQPVTYPPLPTPSMATGARPFTPHSCHLLRGKGRDGRPRFARNRAGGRAGPRVRIAAARFARLIARARRREGDPCGNVMKCHEMSCDVMEACCGLFLFAPFAAAPAFAPCAVFGRVRRRSVTGPCRASGGGLWLAAGLAAGAGRKSVAVIRASFGPGAGRGVPASRAFRVCGRAGVRGRGRAYRGGAVRARDCPRETAHAPRPSVPAGVFFAAPAIAFCRNAEGRPRKPPLSTFILSHFASGQAPSGTKNENAGDFPWNASGNEDRKGALCPDALRVTLSPCHAPFGRLRAGSFVAPAPEPGPIPVSPRHRSRWTAGSTAETAARTEAGPRIGVRSDGGGGAAMVQTG